VAVRGREEGRKKGEGGKEEKRKMKKKKKCRKRKEKEEGLREKDTAGIAAATVTGLARAPVGRDARDEDEQGDGTAMNSDVGTDFFSGDRAGNDFEWTELND